MQIFNSTKIIELGSCAFRQPRADSHCKYLHGYRLTAKFWFESNELDTNNWVVDFGALKGLKNILQEQFDHTTCISYSDPHVETFKQLAVDGVCDLRLMDGVGIEKFAQYCYHVANKHVLNITNSRCWCVRVEVFEHENNSAVYSEVNEQVAATLKEEQPEAAPKEQPTAEQEAEDIASAVENKQQAAPQPVQHDKPGTVKTTNSWVDPKYRGRTSNTWLF